MVDDVDRLKDYLELYKHALASVHSERFARACVRLVGEDLRFKGITGKKWMDTAYLKGAYGIYHYLFGLAHSMSEDERVVVSIVTEVARDLRAERILSGKDKPLEKGEEPATVDQIDTLRQLGLWFEVPCCLTKAEVDELIAKVDDAHAKAHEQIEKLGKEAEAN